MFIDLTHTMTATIPLYPGTPVPRFTRISSVAAHGFAETELQFCSHVGTHVDAPAHVILNGATIDQFPAAKFMGPAYIFRLTDRYGPTVTLWDLAPLASALEKSEFLLLHTGWDRFWGQNEYYQGYPVLTPDAAQRLTKFNLKGLGIDAISVDYPESADLPIHNILLGSGMILVENLTNLAAIPGNSVFFAGLPLKIDGGDGSPVRAVAWPASLIPECGKHQSAVS